MMPDNIAEWIQLEIPGSSQPLRVGSKVKLGRFSLDIWTACFGWYAWGGNRRTCGWHLINNRDQTVKPLYDTDLDDIYWLEC